MSRSGLFIFENEPIWLIHDSNSLFFLNRFGRTVWAIRDTRIEIGRTVPAIRDTRVRLVVLVYCHARVTPNDRLRPNTATTVDYRVGLEGGACVRHHLHPLQTAEITHARRIENQLFVKSKTT
jgi:hypothetical protein